MPGQAPKADIRQANEARILAAAEKVFARHGFRGATTEMIASEAGLPKANVHYYFGTKSKLYRQVLKSVLEGWMEAATSFDSAVDPADALANYVKAKMNFSRRRPHGSRVWAREVMGGADVIEQFLGTTLKRWVDEREKRLRRWIGEGRMSPIEPRSLLYLIWAATQHYADFDRQIEILNGGRRLSNDEYARRTDHVVNMVLRCAGLAPEAVGH